MKGDVFTNDKDQNILANISTSNLIETNFQPIYSTDSLGKMVELIAISKRNIFPVIDNEYRLLGVILLDNIREIMFKSELYDNVFVSDLMTNAPAVIMENESMENVMKLFDETGAWNLPVTKKGKYIGFVSKSSIFSSYRNKLKVNKIE